MTTMKPRNLPTTEWDEILQTANQVPGVQVTVKRYSDPMTWLEAVIIFLGTLFNKSFKDGTAITLPALTKVEGVQHVSIFFPDRWISDAAANLGTLRHELVHVDQILDLGVLRFYAKYALLPLPVLNTGRFELEEEAYVIEAQFLLGAAQRPDLARDALRGILLLGTGAYFWASSPAKAKAAHAVWERALFGEDAPKDPADEL